MTVLSFPTGCLRRSAGITSGRDGFGDARQPWTPQKKTGESTESGNLCTGTDTGIDAAGGLSADP